MKKMFTLALMSLAVAQMHAFTVTGKVYDENGKLMPYVNIYVKQQPQNGTITDLKGVFSIDEFDKGQSLVVSFIGYKTMDIKLKKEPKDTLELKMVEQPILLKEASVGKEKKQSHRKQMKEMIEAVRHQMHRDFPDSVGVRYNVNSDYGVYHENEVIAIEDLGGDIVEIPAMAKNKKGKKIDLVQLKINWITRYRDAHTQQNYLRLDSTLKKETNAKLIHYADSSRWVHKFFWGSGVKYGFEQWTDSPSKWEVEERDSVTVFTYTESRNYIGIVKGKLVLTYYLDPITYSVRNVSQEFVTDVNIPFGYKLTKEQIQMLNTLVIGVQFDKYWVKRAHVDIKRNIIYATYSNGKIGVKEKNIITNIHIEDRRRKEPIDFKQTGSVKVNSAAFGVLPFSKAQEMSKYDLVIKPKPE